MAKLVVFGIEGEKGLWLADLEAGTVSAIDAPAGAIGAANTARNEGATFVRGVNLAITASSQDKAAAGIYD